MLLSSAVFCMAVAGYYEARGEGVQGVTAVMEVIQNRVQSSRYPNDICSVVKQYKQFSAFNGGYKYEANQALADILPYAWKVARGRINNLPDTVLHYHAKSVHPKWADSRKVVTTINNHIFYKGIS